jgi:hypothetical protein
MCDTVVHFKSASAKEAEEAQSQLKLSRLKYDAFFMKSYDSQSHRVHNA